MQPETLKTLVTELLALLGVDIDSITVSTGHRTVVMIATINPEVVIGPQGETLRALNILTRRIVETQHGIEAASFLIDVNRYHERQMDVIRDNARILSQRARLFKHDVDMGPMSSYERLVIHELFADDSEIETTSEGEGKFRHIVLKYKKTASSV